MLFGIQSIANLQYERLGKKTKSMAQIDLINPPQKSQKNNHTKLEI